MSTRRTPATPSATEPGYRIRRVRTSELEEVGRLTVEAYVGGEYVDRDNGYVRELLDVAWRDREAEVWVAAVGGGALLGTVTFAPVGSRLREIARDDEGEFRMLAVTDAARGRGVGAALVEHCLARSRELGYAGVRMSSMDVMVDAHRVYERLGFLRSPDDDWSPQDGVRLVAYAARLG